MSDKAKRIQAYLAVCPGAISGQGGHDHTFKVACAIVKGFDCTADEALGYLQSWNQRCDPPWSDTELSHKVEDADSASDAKRRGYLLEKTITFTQNTVKEVKQTPFLSSSTKVWDPEQSRLERLALHGAGILANLPDWTTSEMVSESPKQLPMDADDHFDAFLGKWEPEKIIWMGNVEDSGSPAYCGHFATPAVWRRRGLPGSNKLWTSGCCYKLGSFSRCKGNIEEHTYSIVESDRLPYPRQGAILRWLLGMGLPIEMIVDTRGASLHGWLRTTHLSKEYLERLTIMLCGIHNGLEPHPTIPGKMRRMFIGGMGCDPATFRGSQPTRLPGADRPANTAEGKRGGVQKIIFLS